MAFDSLRTIPTQRRPFNNASDLELASMEEGSSRPGPSSPPPSHDNRPRSNSPRRVNLNARELSQVLAASDYDGKLSSPVVADDVPELSDLFTLSTYLLPFLQRAHRYALSTIFREFLAESYFTSNSGGPIVTLAKNQIKFSQNQAAGKPTIDLKALSEGRMWTVPGISDVELKKTLRKAWAKHLAQAESSGSLKRTIAEGMKNLIGKAIQGREPFESLEPALEPMHSFIQTFNLPSMPFSLPSPRLFVQHLPSQAPPAGDKAVATGRVPTPKPSAPLSAVVPALSDAEIKQWVSVPPSFHNHAAVVYTALSSNVTVDNVVAGSNLSIRSPMAQPVVFDLLARAVQWVAAKGEVFARDLFREVVGDAWAKSEAWGEAQGWEWVRDLAGPGVVAGGLQSAEDTIGWRNALHGMSSGTGPFGRDDKQAERIELWLKCWDTVNNARLEAMIAEQEGDEHALKGNNMAAISAFTSALDYDPFARPQLLLKRATAYRASELYAQAEQDLIEVTTLPETGTTPTVAPARAMLKKVRAKIKNADKPGPSASAIKKQKKKAKARAKEAGDSAPISGADVAAIMDDAPDKDDDSPPSTGLGLGVEIKQNVVEKEAESVAVEEPAPKQAVEEKPAVVAPPRTTSTTPKAQDPPSSLPSPPSTAASSSSTPPQDSPASTVIPSVSSPSPSSVAPTPEDPTLSSSSSSTSDAVVSSTSNSTETAATSAFDSPLTPRSEAREVSLDRAVVDVKPPSTLAQPVQRQQLHRRTSLVETETVKLEIELDDDEDEEDTEEQEVVFGRVERTVVPDETTPKQEMSSPEQEETETVVPASVEHDAVPSIVVGSYSWDGSYAPVSEPREMEFEAGIWLMVCGQFIETQECNDDDCYFMHELPDHSLYPPPPSPTVEAASPVQAPSAKVAPALPAPAPEPETTLVNSLLRSSSSNLQKLTLEELKEDFPSPNPQDESAFPSPTPDATASPATQFLPTLVFSSHEDQVNEGTPELGDDGGVTRVSTPEQWVELDVDLVNGRPANQETAKKPSPQVKAEDAPIRAPEPATEPQTDKQPKKKKATTAPTATPTTSILMEKRVVPGAAPKDVAPLVPAPAPAPAPSPSATPVDRWWEKGANAIRKEEPQAWATVGGGKAKKGAKAAF